MVCLRTNDDSFSSGFMRKSENRKANPMLDIIQILMNFFAALQISQFQMSAPHEPVVIILD